MALAARPLVSVIIPTFERRWQLRAAIDSVLAQTVEDLEIIVVDDGSTDQTTDFLGEIDDPRLRVLRHSTNLGAAAARNTGIAEARGQYIALLDSDDTWLPAKLATQVAYLRASGGRIRASCTGFRYMLPSGERVDRIPEEIIDRSSLYLGCRCSPGSTLVAETSLLREVGGFDEDLRWLEDWDWLLRCSQKTDIGVVQEALSVVNIAPMRRGLYPVVKQSAERLEAKWRSPGMSFSFFGKFAVRGTLRNELAAFAYCDGQYALACWQMAVSLAFLPRRGQEFAQRIGYRLYCDVRHAVTRRGLPVAEGWRQRTAKVSEPVVPAE